MEFQKYFMDFCEDNFVYLITGSDREDNRTSGYRHLLLGRQSHNCSGNHVFEQSKEVYKTDWKLPDPAAFFLLDKLQNSKFYRKTGNHIEERTGTVNFSVVGRKCNFEERVMYREWDEHKNERRIIAEEFNLSFQTSKH